MDDIRIPVDETVPLEEVARGVVGLRLLMVNVFAVSGEDGWVLVDAGLHGSADTIRRWAGEHFGGEAPRAIVLTHGHFDHVGAIERLLDAWPVPVYAHQEESPYLTGEKAYAPPDPMVGGGLMARLSKLYPRGPIDLGDRLQALPAEGILPGLAEWQWLHTPGHSPGHVSLFRESDRTLIVGDAFCTTRQESFLAVATQRPELHGPPAYFTTDWDAARASVQRLAARRPARVAPGHGQPMAGPDIASGLAELAARFDEIARPADGRYVERPSHG